MARNKGTFNFSANFEPLLKAPLDARTKVSRKSDLVNPAIWEDANSNPWVYSGLLVSVIEDPSISNNGLYFLADADSYTLDFSWIKIGSTDGILDASGTSSSTFQLNNSSYGVILTDSSGNLTVNTYDGSLGTITVSGVYINEFSGAKGFKGEIIGNNISNVFNIPHNMNTLNHIMSIYDKNTNSQIYPEVTRGLNTDIVIFADRVLSSDEYDVIIIGF